MNQKLRKLLSLILLCTFMALTASAQNTLDVQKFSRLDNDLMARVTKPVRDHDEGKLCALIRVVTTLTDFEIRADALGIVEKEQHAGELWLYVPYGAKSISFAHEGYYPLLYQYEQRIEEGVVYELRLGTGDATTANANTQLFVLTHQPDEATVFVDGVEQPSENGVFAAIMSKGNHSFKVTADQYEEVEGNFTLGDQIVRETAKLTPLFGTIDINTQPEDGFKVSINGKEVGETPFKSGHLEPAHYKVRISKKDFFPIDTLVRLREGDQKQLSLRLTSKDDSLFFNRILGGRNISFGVSAGYLFPHVSSTSSGNFTASPINYSLADSREDVSYSSQSGFTAGLMADIRLYKNFYLMLGANYTQVKYTNTFDRTIPSTTILATEDVAYIGSVENNYEEKYTLKMIEVPILLSYRFVMTKYSSLHLNFGPYLLFGLSAKMKLSGTSVSSGNVYQRLGLSILDTPFASYANYANRIDGEIDLYSNEFKFDNYQEGITSQNMPEMYIRDVSPYKKFNYGLKAGVTYELRGFQIGLGYSLQLSNMGRDAFWEGPRIPVINGQTGKNNMSGYKHRIHAFEIKLGYVFRY